MQKDEAATMSGQLVMFKVGGNELSLPVEDVMGIEERSDVTNYTGDVEDVVGLLVISGSTVPVIDLRRKFDLEIEKLAGCNARVLVTMNEDQLVGFLVDEVTGVIMGKSGDPDDDYAAPINPRYISFVSIDRGVCSLPVLETATIVDHVSLAGLFK